MWCLNRRLRVLAVCLLSVASVGENARAPAINSELRARFWRAQAEFIAASAQLQKAKIALEAVQSELAKVCSGQPVADADGEPACPPPKPKE